MSRHTRARERQRSEEQRKKINIENNKGEIITTDSPIWKSISGSIGHGPLDLKNPNLSQQEKDDYVKYIHKIALDAGINPKDLLEAIKIVGAETKTQSWFGCTPERHQAFVPISESILEKEKAKAQKIKDLSNKANEEFTSAKYEEARETINEAYNLDPSNKDIFYLKHKINLEIRKISFQKWKEQKDKTETLNREGDKKYNAKNYKAALEDYEKAISISKVANLLKKYHVNKAHALNKLNQDEEAIRAAEEALKIDPNYEYAKNSIGVIKFKAGKYEEALNYFEEAITLNPKNAQQYSNKAHALIELKRYEEAKVAAEKALEIDQKNKNAQEHLAEAQKGIEVAKIKAEAATFNLEGDKKYKSKDYEGALNDYKNAISKDPTNSVYYSNKANALNNLKRHEEAKIAADEALKIDPNYEHAKNAKVWALNSIGVIKFKAGKYEEALKSFEEAITLNSKNAQQYSNKAHALIKLNRYEEAKTASEKALEINHKHKNAQEHFAEAQKGIEVAKIKAEAEKFNLEGDKKFEIKDYEGALNDYEGAISKDPKNALYFAKKANTLVQLGKNDEALETVKEALKIDAKLQYAIDVQKEVEDFLKLESDTQLKIGKIEKIQKNLEHKVGVISTEDYNNFFNKVMDILDQFKLADSKDTKNKAIANAEVFLNDIKIELEAAEEAEDARLQAIDLDFINLKEYKPPEITPIKTPEIFVSMAGEANEFFQ